MSIHLDVFKELIIQHKDHLRERYQEYPEQLTKMIDLVEQALDNLRDHALAAVLQETSVSAHETAPII